jgi:hypothetical protein
MYLRACKSFKPANHKKDFKNFKLSKSQVCGLAICVTYLRTAHLWYSENMLLVFQRTFRLHQI